MNSKTKDRGKEPTKRLVQKAISDAVSSKLSLNSEYKRDYDRRKRTKEKIPDDDSPENPLSNEMADVYRKHIREVRNNNKNKKKKENLVHTQKCPRGRSQCRPSHVKPKIKWLPNAVDSYEEETECFNSFKWPSKEENTSLDKADFCLSSISLKTGLFHPEHLKISKVTGIETGTKVPKTSCVFKPITDNHSNILNSVDPPSYISQCEQTRSHFSDRESELYHTPAYYQNPGAKFSLREVDNYQYTTSFDDFVPFIPAPRPAKTVKVLEVKQVRFQDDNDDKEFSIPPPHPIPSSFNYNTSPCSDVHQDVHRCSNRHYSESIYPRIPDNNLDVVNQKFLCERNFEGHQSQITNQPTNRSTNQKFPLSTKNDKSRVKYIDNLIDRFVNEESKFCLDHTKASQSIKDPGLRGPALNLSINFSPDSSDTKFQSEILSAMSNMQINITTNNADKDGLKITSVTEIGNSLSVRNEISSNVFCEVLKLHNMISEK